MVFQAAQIMPINTQIINNSNNNFIFTKPIFTSFPISQIPRTKSLFIKGSLSPSPSSPGVDGLGDSSIAHLECCFVSSPSSSSSAMLAPTMKGQYGAFGAVTLEKSKLDMTQKQTLSSPELATGGGGGDIGKRINNGGGDGGDDGGYDDDYFDDFEDGDEGDDGGLFRRRIVFQELFDRKFLDAVLIEWQKTMMDLPAGIRQAFEMGLVSSAQLVKYFAIEARPNAVRTIARGLPQGLSRAFIGRLLLQGLVSSAQLVKYFAIEARPNAVRTIARGLPQGLSRAFIGRMIAEPAFLYRLLLEQATTIGCSAWWEFKTRKDRIKQEWDLALINVLTASACNAVVVWSLAPCRSYGNTFRFDLQNTLQKLPNNVFEKSYPLREFDLQKRVHSFFYKAAQLCFVGLTAGAVQGALSNLCAQKKDHRLSVIMPSVRNNALGTSAFLGLYANLRYRLLCGIDRGLSSYFDVIGVSLFFSTAMRIMNVQIGETSRLAWLGIEADPLVQSDNLMKAYSRVPEANGSNQGSNWLISKNTIVSGLGFLGLPRGTNVDSSDDAPKPRRKRVVRKKVTT